MTTNALFEAPIMKQDKARTMMCEPPSDLDIASFQEFHAPWDDGAALCKTDLHCRCDSRSAELVQTGAH